MTAHDSNMFIYFSLFFREGTWGKIRAVKCFQAAYQV